MPRRLERISGQQQQSAGTGPKLFENKIAWGALCLAGIVILCVVLLTAQPSKTFQLSVKDSEGKALQGITADYSVNGTEATAQTDAEGKIFFQAQKNYNVTVSIPSQQGFAAFQESFSVSDNFSKEIILRTIAEFSGTKTILFQNSDGTRITGKLIAIKLSCANGFRPVPETVSDSEKKGEIKITKDEQCNALSGRVISPEEFRQTTFSLESAATIVTLEKNYESAPLGKIRVKISNRQGNLITETSFTVQLIDSKNFVQKQKFSESFGEVVFVEVPIGSYTISVFDSGGEYGIANSFAAVSASALEQEKTVFPEKNAKGTINVNVIDKASREGIQYATVVLFNSQGEIMAEQETDAEGNPVGFSVTEEDTYKITAVQENYLYGEATSLASGNVTIELELMTPENSGIVEVHVTDEDSLPVENASVALKNSADEILPYPARQTDAKGIALFRGVKEELVSAFAEKFPASGYGNIQEIILNQKNILAVQMQIGNATIAIEAADEAGNPLDAQAEVFSETGTLLKTVSLQNGKAGFEAKADKKVFVVVKMPGYETVQTIAKQLWPEEIIKFNVQLPAGVPTVPELNFEGIFQGEQKTGLLSAGQKYLAVFSIDTPESLAKGALHFRVEENLAITNVFFGNPSNVIKGTSFSPPLGFETDSASDYGGEAKWVNIEFLPAGETTRFFAAIEFSVKDSAQPDSLLKMHYRAEFANSDLSVTRIPYDSELGSLEGTSSKQALYAKTNDLEFSEGTDADCMETLCYGNEWIFDNSKKSLQREDYLLALNRDYNLNFRITNNSNAMLENLSISIQTGSEGEAEFKTFAAGSGIEAINNDRIENTAFSLARQETMNFNALFRAKKTSLAFFEIKIRNGSEEIFSKTIWLDATASKEILLEITPEKIPLLSAQEITAKAGAQGFPLEGAEVWMAIIAADNSRATQKASTNAQGEAKFTLQSAMPGTRLVFEAEKEDYYAEPFEKKLETNVFSVSPEALESKIDNKFNTEETLEAEIASNAGKKLEIFSVSVNGDSKGLLDLQAMNMFFSSLQGAQIGALETKKISLVKTKFMEGAVLEKDASLQLETVLTITDPETGQKFDKKIPLTVNIHAVSAAAMNCIKINKTEWLGYTSNNRAVLELELENTCAGEAGNEIKNLVAKTEWAGEAGGVVEVFDTQTGNSEVAGENIWRAVRKDFLQGEKISAELVFTPKPNTLGKTSEFKIVFDGQAETEKGLKFVGSSEINAKIDIASIEQCIKIDKDALEIKNTETSAGFSIDAGACAIPMEIALCRNDSGCKGGALEGSIKLNAANMQLSPGHAKASITVSRENIAGIYGITLEAKTQNSDWIYVKTIDIFIEPGADSVFTLDKYAFSVIGNSAKDSATIFNPNLTEDIEVIAPVQAWQESIQNSESFFDPELAGTGATQLELENAKIAADLAKQKIQEMTQKAASEADKATQMQEQALQMLNNAKQQAEQASQQAQDVAGQANQLLSMAELLAGQGKSIEEAASAGCDSPDPITRPLCCTAMTAATAMNASLQQAKIYTTIANTAAGAASSSAQQGQGNCNEGQNSGNQGLENSLEAQKAACATEEISARSGQGSGQAKQAAADMLNAAQQDKQCGSQMQNAAAKFGQAGTNLAGTAAQIAIVESQSPAIAACPVAAAPLTAFTAQFTAFKAAENSLAGASAAAQQQAQAANSAAQQASQASQAANAQSAYAQDQLNKLSVVEINSEEAAKFGKGRTIGILGSYMGLGALIGSYSGNAYSIGLENCSQGFKSILPVFITNLKNDKTGISLDNEKIFGNWNTEEAKIFGEYESQTAGVFFENKGIESEKPVFAVATITAFKHVHANPTTIEAGTYAGAGTNDAITGSNTFGPFNVPDSEKIPVEQKFHLKFTTKEKKSAQAVDFSSRCAQGALMGATGTDALPKIKLDWSWNDSSGISEQSCDANNPNSVFCDAAQFSIMAGKRLKNLQEFVEKNTNLACPKNPSIEDLKWIVEKWNPYLAEMQQTLMPENLQAENPDCWMPKTSFLYDSKPAINYFVEEAAKSNSVSWTAKIKNPEDLKKTFLFNALLIKDGYSQDFQKDFANYYERIVLLDAPEWFTKNPAGKWMDYFSNAQKLSFSQKFLDSTELADAGTFEAFFNIDFGNKWQFFNEAKNPAAKISVEFALKKTPEKESVFYYLPWDSSMNSEIGANSTGYGTGYSNAGKEFTISSTENVPVSTKQNNAGISMLETKTIEDTKTINSSFSKRGTLLEINETAESARQLLFYPSYATPIIMQVSSAANQESFSAYYQLREADVPVKSAENLAFWDAVQKCDNFDGTPLQEAFNSSPDRYAQELDTGSAPLNTYAVDFAESEKTGNVFLKTVFYSPAAKSLALASSGENSRQNSGVLFKTPDSGFGGSIDLQGISTSSLNSKIAQKSVSSLQKLFDAVREQAACITSSEEKTIIWWNTENLMRENGSSGSMLSAEAGAECA